MLSEIKKRRHEELAECFAVIDTCLRCYYNGERHMYRPLAGQLRILLCDQKPLLSRVFPDIKVNPLRPIEWLKPSDVELFEGVNARMSVSAPEETQFRAARMPFLITVYSNGLQVADVQLTPGQLVTLHEWVSQLVTVSPSEISVREIVRSVSDKGGGAHVDDEPNQALQDMMMMGPRSLGVHVLFIVAVGRLAQRIGLYYAQFRERFGYTGKLEDVRALFNDSHPTVLNRARVSDEIASGPQSRYAYTLLKPI